MKGKSKKIECEKSWMLKRKEKNKWKRVCDFAKAEIHKKKDSEQTEKRVKEKKRKRIMTSKIGQEDVEGLNVMSRSAESH